MLNSSLSTASDHNANIINDDKLKIINVVEFYQGDELCQNIEKQEAPSPLKCDPCANTTSVNSSWEWFGLFVLWFIALTVLFWLIYYSLKPPFVLQSDGNQIDTAKVLLAAVISAFVLIVIIWLIKAAMGK